VPGLTDPNVDGASLAACQKYAIAPTRVGVSVAIIGHVAHALGPALHASLAPESVILGYDGSVSLAEAPSASRLDASRAKPAYLAPEQVSASDVDRRVDVWSLGVVLWELLTGTTLFARATASETRIAIIDDPILEVRDVNPEVPAVVADVLRTALQRDRKARFDTPEAFARALASAAASCGVAAPTKQELGAWVAERVPRAASGGPRSAPGRAAPAPAATAASDIPDFDVPGASRAHRSLPSIETVMAPSVPELRAAAPVAPSISGASAPPASGRGSSPALPSGPPQTSRASAPSAQPGSGRSIAFDGGDDDDDDFDMEIERNVAGTSLPTAQSSRTSGTHAAARPSGKLGLELAAPSRMVREKAERTPEDYEPGTGIKLAGLALVTLIGGATAFALWNYVHHAGGFDVMKSMPHAFDGTSATESGAISLVSFVVAVIVGFVGLRFKPHAWAVVAAGGTILLLALAMVTVTLASTGENPTPPDGALLVPYLFPAALLMFAIGVEGRAARLFATSYGARRLSAVPIAALGGAIAFLAFEASRFAR
jgi:hypothetical protein